MQSSEVDPFALFSGSLARDSGACQCDPAQYRPIHFILKVMKHSAARICTNAAQNRFARENKFACKIPSGVQQLNIRSNRNALNSICVIDFLFHRLAERFQCILESTDL
jgi:hypothetical protein